MVAIENGVFRSSSPTLHFYSLQRSLVFIVLLSYSFLTFYFLSICFIVSSYLYFYSKCFNAFFSRQFFCLTCSSFSLFYCMGRASFSINLVWKLFIFPCNIQGYCISKNLDALILFFYNNMQNNPPTLKWVFTVSPVLLAQTKLNLNPWRNKWKIIWEFRYTSLLLEINFILRFESVNGFKLNFCVI